MLEREWQGKVREVEQMYGWLGYHTYDSRRSDAGFPDLVLVKGLRVVYAELKKENGRVSAEQKVWLRALEAAGQEVAVWRPSDLPKVLRVLGPRAERAVLPDKL